MADIHPSDDLALHPQDFNFPRVFALHYDIEEFRADAILYNVDESLIGQQIQLTDDGIISPLRQDEIIDYDRLVIIAYDSVSNSATIIDQLPDDALERGNFDSTGDFLLVTNYANLDVHP